jgi:hypothetical protein
MGKRYQRVGELDFNFQCPDSRQSSRNMLPGDSELAKALLYISQL